MSTFMKLPVDRAVMERRYDYEFCLQDNVIDRRSYWHFIILYSGKVYSIVLRTDDVVWNL